MIILLIHFHLQKYGVRNAICWKCTSVIFFEHFKINKKTNKDLELNPALLYYQSEKKCMGSPILISGHLRRLDSGLDTLHFAMDRRQYNVLPREST